MELNTRYNGVIQIEDSEIIKFPQGIPGFLDKKRYVLLKLSNESPFLILQSVDEVELAFITISPWDVFPKYDFQINQATENLLEVKDPEDILVTAICTIKNNIKDMTVNLAAPVVINYKKSKGKQVVLEDNKYITKFPVFPEQKRQEAK